MPSTSSSSRSASSASLCPVGLHPTRIGDVFGGRYTVEGKLGKGQFSTVWLCRDVSKLSRASTVALKVYRSVDRFAKFAEEEAAILRHAQGCEALGLRPPPGAGGAAARPAPAGRCVVGLLEHFLHEGPDCRHACIALEVLGPCLLTVARASRGDRVPLALLRAAARDSLRGLDLLHRGAAIVHTDIKPENILAKVAEGAAGAAGPPRKRRRGGWDVLPGGAAPRWRRTTGQDVLDLADSPHDVTFVLADLGNSVFVDKQASQEVSTCEYKSPEVLLHAGYGLATDVWSLACTLFEAATGRYLLDPRRVFARPGALAAADAQPAQPAEPHSASRGSKDFSEVEEHVAQVVELCGVPPDALLSSGAAAERAVRAAAPGASSAEGGGGAAPGCSGWVLRTAGLRLDGLPRCGLAARLQEHLAPEEARPLLELLEPMLRAAPAERAEAREVLEAVAWLWDYEWPEVVGVAWPEAAPSHGARGAERSPPGAQTLPGSAPRGGGAAPGFPPGAWADIVYDLAVELGDEFRWSALVFRAKRHLGAALQCAKEGRGMSGLGLWATAFRWLAGTSDASALKLDGLSNAAETHLWTALSAWVSVEAFARTGRSGTIFRWLVPRDFLEEWGPQGHGGRRPA